MTPSDKRSLQALAALLTYMASDNGESMGWNDIACLCKAREVLAVVLNEPLKGLSDDDT